MSENKNEGKVAEKQIDLSKATFKPIKDFSVIVVIHQRKGLVEIKVLQKRLKYRIPTYLITPHL